MDNDSPDIGMLITVYNAADHVASLNRSITEFAQSAPRITAEVVIVDDGSTDGSGAMIAESFERSGGFARVTLLSPGRVGRAAALNIGARAISSPIFAIHDCDDDFFPDRLASAVNIFSSEKFDLLLQSGYAVDAKGKITRNISLSNPPSIFKAMLRIPTPHTFWVWRKDYFSHIGEYDEKLDRLLDYDILLRTLFQSGHISVDKNPAGNHYKYASFFAKKNYLQSQFLLMRILISRSLSTRNPAIIAKSFAASLIRSIWIILNSILRIRNVTRPKALGRAKH